MTHRLRDMATGALVAIVTLVVLYLATPWLIGLEDAYLDWQYCITHHQQDYRRYVDIGYYETRNRCS